MINNELSKGYKMNKYPNQDEMKIKEEIMALKTQIEQLQLAIYELPEQIISSLVSCNLLSLNIKDQNVSPSSSSQFSDIEILNKISEPFEKLNLEIGDRSSSNYLPANYYETEFYLHWKKNFDKKTDKTKWLFDGHLTQKTTPLTNQSMNIMPYNKELDLNYWLK